MYITTYTSGGMDLNWPETQCYRMNSRYIVSFGGWLINGSHLQQHLMLVACWLQKILANWMLRAYTPQFADFIAAIARAPLKAGGCLKKGLLGMGPDDPGGYTNSIKWCTYMISAIVNII